MFRKRIEAGYLSTIVDSKDLLFKVATEDPLLEKIAEDSLKERPVPEGHKRVLINALGAGEYWWFNKKGDYFPEKMLNPYPKLYDDVEYGYPTYETHGKVYIEHGGAPVGKVVKALWHDPLKRVFVLADVKDDYILPRLELLKEGSQVGTSMGTAVQFDACSICAPHDTFLTSKHPKVIRKLAMEGELPGVRAVPTQISCDHIPSRVTEHIPELDRYVYMVNYYPTFIDISLVNRPADELSSVLKKVASDVALKSPLYTVQDFVYKLVLPNVVHRDADLKTVNRAIVKLGAENALKLFKLLRVPLTSEEWKLFRKTASSGRLTYSDLYNIKLFCLKRTADPAFLKSKIRKVATYPKIIKDSPYKEHKLYILDISSSPSVTFQDFDPNDPIVKLAKGIFVGVPEKREEAYKILSGFYAQAFAGIIKT